MTRASVQRCMCLIALCWLGIGFYTTAVAEEGSTVDQLQAVGKLQIKSWIAPAQQIVVNQQVTLVIEVATEQWFSGGTRVGRLEVDDALVLQREQFALNSSRREQGVTWSVQQWRISVYPQRSGEFDIRPLAVNVSVAGAERTPISGEMYTQPIKFNASVPDAVAALATAGAARTSWLAAPAFTAAESYSPNHDNALQNLSVGDAVQRTIVFKADNVAAMMLPEVTLHEQDGLAIYQKPPRLSDDVNRGDYLAQRVETITYVIEKPGDYVLPALTYYWWDLSSQSLQVVKLPEQKISMAASAVASTPMSQARPRTPQQWAVLIGKLTAAIVLVIVVWLVWRRRQRKTTAQGLTQGERVLLKKILRASRQADAQQAVSLLYQWLDHYQKDRFDGSIRSLLRDIHQQELHQQELALLFEQLMQRAYANSDDLPEVHIETFIDALRAELRAAGRNNRWCVQPLPLKIN